MEYKELKQTIIDERTGIEYNLVNGYYIPNILLHKPRRTGNIGKYGRMRARYLKEHKKAEYSIMLIENELTSHLLDIDDIFELPLICCFVRTSLGRCSAGLLLFFSENRTVGSKNKPSFQF